MRQATFLHWLILKPLLAFLWALIDPSCVQASDSWVIVTHPGLAADPRFQLALQDLRAIGAETGITFDHKTDGPGAREGVIAVGAPERCEFTRVLVKEGSIRLDGVEEAQGFEIRTAGEKSRRLILIAGGSDVGDIYGLYWLWDRIRVHRSIPDLNLVRIPRLPIRHTGARNESDLHDSLRFSANWVSGGHILDLVPWGVEPEDTRNEQNRQKLRGLIGEAHKFGMKFLATCDEITYHPKLLKEFDATLDPSDPALWAMLQEKYRRLFNLLPELDGVRIRTGELTRTYGDYEPHDVMHDPPDSDWSLERRYQTFVRKMHEVVVGEFGKIYFHRTWVTNTREQHSDPDVYKEIFTDEIPTKNLFLSPYLSLGDRWYYQPFNPTFNQTPHKMVVLLATLDYHAHQGAPVFPSFPGRYYQEGLRTILSDSSSNLVGYQTGAPSPDGWSTSDLTSYTAFRLGWNPDEDLRRIAEDFAAIHVGREAAPTMAEIILLSQTAYKDGIYVKPVAESISGNTLPHLRLTTFELRGIPEVDRGREHIDWLRSTIYDPCIGKMEEAVQYLNRGLEAVNRMQTLYEEIVNKIPDPDRSKAIGDSLELTRRLVETNNHYIKTIFAYFQFRDDKSRENKRKLDEGLSALVNAKNQFEKAPGFCYDLYGIDQLIENADQMTADPERAEEMLARAPSRSEVEELISQQARKHSEILRGTSDEAVKVLHWRGKVDGRDVLAIRGDSLSIQHLHGDAIHEMKHEFPNPLPEQEVAVVVKDIKSSESAPFVLEQPHEENDYTARIYLNDKVPSYTWWELELYYLDKPPGEVGLESTWR